MKYKTKIDGHTIEIRSNNTGSIDPWSLDYADENGISLMITSDMAEFALVDGEDIYQIRNFRGSILGEKLINSEFDTFDEVIDWLNENSTKSRKTLSEMIDILSKRKNK